MKTPKPPNRDALHMYCVLALVFTFVEATSLLFDGNPPAIVEALIVGFAALAAREVRRYDRWMATPDAPDQEQATGVNR